MQTLVSIVTATRNRPDLLARALRSVERQSYGNLDVVVVDDGSSEETLSTTRQLLSELGTRFRLLASSMADAPGTGPAAARNRGAMASRGEFVAFLDDDDYWIEPNFLDLAVRSLTVHDGDYFFGHVQGERDGQAQDPGWVADRQLLVRERLVNDRPPVYELSRKAVTKVARHYLIHPSHSVIRRETIVRAGGFFTHLWSYAEDANLMMRVLDVSRRVLYTPELVTRLRNPVSGSVSLRDTHATQMLQRVLAAQQARLACATVELRKAARAYEAWTYRDMSRIALKDGHAADANAFARQALVTYPTLGALLFTAKTAVAAAMSGGRAGVRPSGA